MSIWHIKREADAKARMLSLGLQIFPHNPSTSARAGCIPQTFADQSLCFALCQPTKTFQGPSGLDSRAETMNTLPAKPY